MPPVYDLRDTHPVFDEGILRAGIDNGVLARPAGYRFTGRWEPTDSQKVVKDEESLVSVERSRRRAQSVDGSGTSTRSWIVPSRSRRCFGSRPLWTASTSPTMLVAIPYGVDPPRSSPMGV